MSFGDPWFYIVLLGAAALAYALLLPGRKPAADSKAGGAEELEATLEQYMSEIERENEELIGLVTQMKQDFTSKQLAHQEGIAELRQRLADVELTARQNASRLERLEQYEPVASAGLSQVAEDVKPAESAIVEPEALLPELLASDAPEPEPVESVRDRYPELFDLYAKGKSVDMIAKTIGLQRGEVQLILQLSKREESQ